MASPTATPGAADISNRSPIHAPFLRAKHRTGLTYDTYLATNPDKAARWTEFARGVHLTAEQDRLLKSFTRVMKVIVVSGIWCGDCVQQGPMIDAIVRANPSKIDLRWLDRDEHADLSSLLTINQGARVPVVIFAAEDFEPVAVFGDRTLTRYRALAAKYLGPSCPVPGAPLPPDEIAATLQEWVDQFERVQLLLRLSTRLRARHAD